MRCLVIGGCGFIGSHLVDELLANGHSIRVFDRKPEQFRPPLPRVDYQYGDFRDKSSMAEALTGVDIVFHTASTTFPGTANLDTSADVKDNLVSALGLLDMLREAGQERIVFMSSGGTVYGPPDIVPTPEDHPLRPGNSYGIVKVAIEHYLWMYRELYGLSPVSIRASNPYGERQGHLGVQGVVATFLNRIRTGSQIEIWGDGSVVRDYLYVGDLARLAVKAGISAYSGPLNAGSGQGCSLNQLVDTMRDVTGRDVDVRHKSARPVDIPRSILDVSLAKREFGWTAETPLEKGIGLAWDWLNSLDHDD